MKPTPFNPLWIVLVAAGLSWVAPPAVPAPLQVSQRPALSNYDRLMKAGYTAVQNRDYPAALEKFRKALALRPQDTYALKAIQNVEGYLERQNIESFTSRERPAAPWSEPPLPQHQVPAVLLSEWPQQWVWADGSAVGYGPAGGEGPNYLAYVQVKGQRCLYNIWSFLGREHLESFLEQLRLVQGAS